MYLSAKSRCRPTFSQRNKTSRNIPLCSLLSFRMLLSLLACSLAQSFPWCPPPFGVPICLFCPLPWACPLPVPFARALCPCPLPVPSALKACPPPLGCFLMPLGWHSALGHSLSLWGVLSASRACSQPLRRALRLWGVPSASGACPPPLGRALCLFWLQFLGIFNSLRFFLWQLNEF